MELQLGMPGRSFETSITQYRDTHTHTCTEVLYKHNNLANDFLNYIDAHMRIQCSSHTRTYTHTQCVGICGYQDENAIDRHSHIFLLTCAKFITSLHSDVIHFKKTLLSLITGKF